MLLLLLLLLLVLFLKYLCSPCPGNCVVDVAFAQPITNVKTLAAEVCGVVGVVEHGLFVDMASVVLVAEADGTITTMV